MMDVMSRYRLFIGNPGAGKSTLANCIAGDPLFKSGISLGSGKTYKLEKGKHGGVMYLDTPGLADIKMRKAAASAITEALSQNGSYQIFFVVTLSAGRLRPEDLATIWLVLLNAPNINFFSIIINKLSKREHDCLQDHDEKSRLLAPLELMSGRHKYKVFLLLNNLKLEDVDDKIVDYPKLVDFVKDAQWVNIDSSNVSEIPGDDESFNEKLNSVAKNLSNNYLPVPKKLNEAPITNHRLFIGNPGAGKSTLANCIAGRILFKSGLSFGSGKTYKLGKEKHDGIMYLDTPGLADIKLRQAAASAITEALRRNGSYQIFFVVTLSAGRLRPEDLTTMWLVLHNAPDISHFSIIINKLTKTEYDGLQNNNEKLRLLASLELLGGHHKYTVFLLLKNPKLEDADDKIVNDPELVSFVRNAQCVTVVPSNVRDIPGDDNSFKEQLDSLKNEISNLSPDHVPTEDNQSFNKLPEEKRNLLVIEEEKKKRTSLRQNFVSCWGCNCWCCCCPRKTCVLF